jgi:F-type H+-transporting ATPase subunit a
MILAVEGDGFQVPSLGHLFTFEPFFTFDVAGMSFRVTFVTFVMFGLTVLLSALFITAFARPAIVPGKLQNVMEAAIDGIRQNVVHQTIGPEGERFLPYLTALFFFVFALNVMGIMPIVMFPISSQMGIPVFFAVVAYVLFLYVGIRKQGFIGYFKELMFPPGVPKLLYPILTPIEVASKLVFRPVTLAVRLFANAMAGHVMLAIFFVATGFFLLRSDALPLQLMTPIPLLMSVLLVGFELFIAFIQAFIITILTAVYIDESLHPAH